MDKIKLENFMKRVFLCVLALGIIAFSGVLFSGCENLETVALKNGVITHEYTIGDSFDPSGAIIVEKTNKGYKEFYLSYCVYSLEGFDTSHAVENAKAQIIYKNHVIEFNYSVSLNSLGAITTSVDGAIFNPVTQTYEITYDGNSHNINVDCNVEGVTITKILTNLNGEKVPFTGAVNSRSYNVTITASKEGYATKTETVNIYISKQTFVERDIVYRVYQYNQISNDYDILMGSYKHYNDIYYVYNQGQYEQMGGVGPGFEYIAPPSTNQALSMYKVVANVKDKTTHQEVILGEMGNIGATELSDGQYLVAVTGFSPTLDGASNYAFVDLSKDSQGNLINPIFKYSIVKSSLSETVVTNSSVGFENASVSCNGVNRAIVATQEITVAGESPTSIDYSYYQGEVRVAGSEGVSDAGTYTVKATYNFEHYVSVTLEATLTITA